MDDYPGELPVVVTIYPTLKPSLYQILYRPKPESLVLTDKPFPWQEWFSKDRVLPAGELSLFDVGDTLVAYGYFVPGARPSGPSTRAGSCCRSDCGSSRRTCPTRCCTTT